MDVSGVIEAEKLFFKVSKIGFIDVINRAAFDRVANLYYAGRVS